MLGNANISSKLLYFFGFRADIEVRVQTNASPFLQGLLGAGFYPLSSEVTADGNCVNNDYSRAYLASRTNFSTCQPVYLDAASGNTGILHIPYTSENLIYNLTQSEYPSECGSVVLYVMSQLKGPTSAEKVGVTVFARFVNIELSVPTLAPIKGGFNVGIDLLHASQSGNTEKLNSIIESYDLPQFSAQIDETDHANATGLVSGVSDTVSRVSGALSNIPIIGEIAKPVHWVSDAVSGVARMFGLSKPQDLKGAETFANQPARGMQNSDVISRSNQMALFVDNEISVSSDIFRSEVDEMAIKSLVSREGLASSVTWKKTDANKKIILALPVRPNFNDDSNTPPDRTNLNINHLTAVSQMFRHWRGTIKYRVKVVKTAYHTGRLALTFSPGTLITSGDLEIGRSYSTILDLRDSNEVMFEIPFRSTWPWKNTRDEAGGFPIASRSSALVANATGTFTISVINNLNSTDSVQDDVEVLVFTSGGDDMTFMYPIEPLFHPGFIHVPTPPSTPTFESDEPVYEAQSLNDVDENEPSDVAEGKQTLIPLAQFSGTDPLAAAKVCGGEVITNCRSLIKRFEYLSSIAPISPNTTVEFNPNYIPPLYNGKGAIGTANKALFTYISAFFRAMRGSMRALAHTKTPLPTGVMRVKLRSDTVPIEFLTRLSTDTSTNYSTRIQSLFTNEVIEDTVPFYCASQYMVIGRRQDPGVQPKVPFLSYEYSTGATVPMEFFRAGGDDFSFGIAGPLPVYHRSET